MSLQDARALEVVAVSRRDGGPVPATIYRPAAPRAGPALVLAHGAGAPQRHPFMVGAATAIAQRGATVVTFDFPYMADGRRLPDKAVVLERTFIDVVAAVRPLVDGAAGLFIGGKSMGGRMATHVAAFHPGDVAPIAGIVCLGYPLHPPGRLDTVRDAHLAQVRVPVLVVQGSRDAFGTPEELGPALARVGAAVALHVVDGADHGFVRRGRGISKPPAGLDDVWDAIVSWLSRTAGSAC